MDVSLAKEKRGRRQGNTSKELTLELILFLGPLVPLFLVNETLFHSRSYGCFLSKGEERQEAGKHQQRINSGVNSFPWSPGSSSPGE